MKADLNHWARHLIDVVYLPTAGLSPEFSLLRYVQSADDETGEVTVLVRPDGGGQRVPVTLHGMPIKLQLQENATLAQRVLWILEGGQ